MRIQRTGGAAKFVGNTAVRVPANASAAYTVAVKLPGGLSRGNYYLAACTPAGTGDGDLGCATSAEGHPRQGRHARPRQRRPAARAGHGRQGGAGRDLHLGRAHARQARRARVPGDRQHGLLQRAQRRLHQLRRAHEPVPAGHARRPAAALDAVPERLQPRLRSAQLDHQHDRPGPRLHGRVDHRQRAAGDVQVRPADLPGRSQRPGRSRSAGASHRPGDADQRRQPEPAGVRADVQRRRTAEPSVPRDASS